MRNAWPAADNLSNRVSARTAAGGRRAVSFWSPWALAARGDPRRARATCLSVGVAGYQDGDRAVVNRTLPVRAMLSAGRLRWPTAAM